MTTNKDALERALSNITFISKTLGYLEVVPPYGDANYRTEQCDKAIQACEEIRNALQTQLNLEKQTAELVELLDEAYGELVNIDTNGALALLKTRIVTGKQIGRAHV